MARYLYGGTAAGDTFEFDVANESSSVAQSITQARFSVVKVG